jgi:hypothetical protein
MTLLPPPQYDVPPPMPVIEHVLEYDALQVWCSMFPGPGHLLFVKDRTKHFNGCSGMFPLDGRKVCFVWYLRGDTDALRHERAHCAGWPADHPGGR